MSPLRTGRHASEASAPLLGLCSPSRPASRVWKPPVCVPAPFHWGGHGVFSRDFPPRWPLPRVVLGVASWVVLVRRKCDRSTRFVWAAGAQRRHLECGRAVEAGVGGRGASRLRWCQGGVGQPRRFLAQGWGLSWEELRKKGGGQSQALASPGPLAQRTPESVAKHHSPRPRRGLGRVFKQVHVCNIAG